MLTRRANIAKLFSRPIPSKGESKKEGKLLRQTKWKFTPLPSSSLVCEYVRVRTYHANITGSGFVLWEDLED